MSVYDALTIPILFFVLMIVVGMTYYQSDIFIGIFQDYNDTMNNDSQYLYGKFMGINDFSLDMLNYTVVGMIFMLIYMSLVFAAIVYAHPGYFLILVFLGAAIVFVWYMLNSGLDTVIAAPEFNVHFDATAMSWFYVVKENMYLLICVVLAALFVALYHKGGAQRVI